MENLEYNSLSSDLKDLIDKEADARFRFKMNEFLTSIKNIYPFYVKSPDPYTNLIGKNMAEHYVILHERFIKEMNMGFPADNLIYENRKKFKNKFESFLDEKLNHFFRGSRNSIDEIYRFKKGIFDFIEQAFNVDKN